MATVCKTRRQFMRYLAVSVWRDEEESLHYRRISYGVLAALAVVAVAGIVLLWRALCNASRKTRLASEARCEQNLTRYDEIVALGCCFSSSSLMRSIRGCNVACCPVAMDVRGLCFTSVRFFCYTLPDLVFLHRNRCAHPRYCILCFRLLVVRLLLLM